MSHNLADPLRPVWATQDQTLQDYFDTEWGRPISSEQGLFERISLEAFQSGLSWRTILTKREAFREHFHDFHPETVASFDEHKVEELLSIPDIVRNRRKISATIHNAQTLIKLRGEHSLAHLIWSHTPKSPLEVQSDFVLPAETDESRALAKTLKSLGFQFVGPVTCFALMSAVGVVNPHPVGSKIHGEIEVLRRDTLSALGFYEDLRR